jgi:hypothetical protein
MIISIDTSREEYNENLIDVLPPTNSPGSHQKKINICLTLSIVNQLTECNVYLIIYIFSTYRLLSKRRSA